jgi:iron complex outermembrane receptor protein
MGPRNLADAFNASERDLDDTTVDAVARFWLPADDLTWRATLARKTRVGGYVERFSWLPTEASGGLADGNTYIGDQALDPEVAWQIEGGLDWSNERAYVRPTLYYRRIDDFIQGVPVDATPEQIDSPLEMVSAMNGDPSPLRFANVDATIHGFDMDFGYLLSEQWRLDGVLNWLRGERRDIDDKLYRMAPASLLLALSWQNDDWVYTLEGLAVAAQDDVSQGNSEARSAGYGVYAARADWRVSEDLELQLGLENLTDRSYSQHLAGYNRVADSDVPLGERLPGAGRSLHLRLNWRW